MFRIVNSTNTDSNLHKTIRILKLILELGNPTGSKKSVLLQSLKVRLGNFLLLTPQVILANLKLLHSHLPWIVNWGENFTHHINLIVTITNIDYLFKVINLYHYRVLFYSISFPELKLVPKYHNHNIDVKMYYLVKGQIKRSPWTNPVCKLHILLKQIIN